MREKIDSSLFWSFLVFLATILGCLVVDFNFGKMSLFGDIGALRIYYYTGSGTFEVPVVYHYYAIILAPTFVFSSFNTLFELFDDEYEFFRGVRAGLVLGTMVGLISCSAINLNTVVSPVESWLSVVLFGVLFGVIASSVFVLLFYNIPIGVTLGVAITLVHFIFATIFVERTLVNVVYTIVSIPALIVVNNMVASTIPMFLLTIERIYFLGLHASHPKKIKS